jgi:hypothetical protein
MFFLIDVYIFLSNDTVGRKKTLYLCTDSSMGHYALVAVELTFLIHFRFFCYCPNSSIPSRNELVPWNGYQPHPNSFSSCNRITLMTRHRDPYRFRRSNYSQAVEDAYSGWLETRNLVVRSPR